MQHLLPSAKAAKPRNNYTPRFVFYRKKRTLFPKKRFLCHKKRKWPALPALHELDVPDPILERFVAGRSAQSFLQPCLRHKEPPPNGWRLLLAEFHWNTLD